MGIIATNPATGEILKEYDEMSQDLVTSTIEAAHEAFLKWRRASFSERAELMRKIAGILRDRKQELAQLMTEEMGKITAQGVSEIEKCAWVCEYYAEHAEEHLADDVIATDATKSYVTFQPLGVVLAVMPWNFPFWQVFRFAAPAIMAGNVGLLKHASNVPGCALAIEEMFTQAGFPKNIFCTLLIGSKDVKPVIEHPNVIAVTLTGSTPAGQQVASQAGALVKKTVLELGGSDPYIILEDADISYAAKICAQARLINGGQSCIAAKRFIVVEQVREDFEREFVALMHQQRMGDPADPQTTLGPQARIDLRDSLHEQVKLSIAKGATLLLGGNIPRGKGAFYPATVLTNVSKGMPAYDEELFGPVASIISARDEQEAIRIANDSVFGLGAAVFTADAKRGERIAREELNAGCCFVNGNVASDPRVPFGGIKASGYGRELGSYGIREFVNIKSVVVK